LTLGKPRSNIANRMLAKVKTSAVVGLEGAIVEVEVDISPGLPSFTIVGLPDAAVQEARERVRAAIKNSGFAFPMKRIVVNLAPADLKKAGPAYDLPIAVGILLSSELVSADVSQTILLGELSLDGGLRHTNGILPMVALACQEKVPQAIVPEVDAQEASLIEGTKIIPVASLPQLVSYFRGEIPAPEYKRQEVSAEEHTPPILPAKSSESALTGQG
jgi:magnesium chelatase family protein